LPKGFDIVLEKKAPEIMAHVVCRIVNVSGDPEKHLAVISEDHGVFKGASRVRRQAGLGNPVEMDDITPESSLIDKDVAREDVVCRNRWMHCEMNALSRSRGKEGGRYGGAKGKGDIVVVVVVSDKCAARGLGDDVEAACACHQSACPVLIRAATDERYMVF
jgi:hypothetical protein